MIHPLLRAVALCCLLPLAGCWESPLPEGVVATVNGEAIHIRTVQAYMDGNSPGLGTRNQPPDTNQLRRDYGEALSDIIIQRLAIQDLQRRGIRGVEERARDLEEEIRDDYGSGEFDNYLAEESLDPAEWRRLLRGFVALQMLEDVVLEPELRVSRDEVLAYYKEHEAVFRLPERYRVCFASSASKEALQQWREAFATDRTPAVGKDVSTRCTEIPVRELTPPWNKDIPSLKPGESTRPRPDENGGFVSMGLMARLAAEPPPPAAVYALIEREVRQQKRLPAFDDWLEDALAHSRITVSPLLREEVLRQSVSSGDAAETTKEEKR